MGFFTKVKSEIVEVARKASSFFAASADVDGLLPQTSPAVQIGAMLDVMRRQSPMVKAIGAEDSAACGINGAYNSGSIGLSDTMLGFFMGQGFIGYQVCAFLSQNWLIDKACAMPARDAIRKGWEVVSEDGSDLTPEVVAAIRKQDRRMAVASELVEFVKLGRVFGMRIAFFNVLSTDPKYYEYPFNPDGITPGSYRGIVQVDPYWCAPELDQNAAANPASANFYEPTFWIINGKRYHRSHLIIYRTGDLPDLLKPQYQYGGVSIPQRIVERVYCAERTANEGPALAMSKRLNVFYTDATAALANREQFMDRMKDFASFRDNFGIKIADKDADKIEQFETSLADVDAVIMTSYQLVAAAADVPATKLMGTSPKGFGAAGEYEESSYHEMLESMQAHDITPLLDRHYLLLARSHLAPLFGDALPGELAVNWMPLDSLTGKEQAEINKIKADTGAVLVGSGALDYIDERNRLRTDKKSDYSGIEEAESGAIEVPDDQGAIDPAAANVAATVGP